LVYCTLKYKNNILIKKKILFLIDKICLFAWWCLTSLSTIFQLSGADPGFCRDYFHTFMTIIDISPRIFSLMYCCCVSIIIVIFMCPPVALIWLINLFLFLFLFRIISKYDDCNMDYNHQQTMTLTSLSAQLLFLIFSISHVRFDLYLMSLL
jgi:hypothetical protein